MMPHSLLSLGACLVTPIKKYTLLVERAHGATYRQVPEWCQTQPEVAMSRHTSVRRKSTSQQFQHVGEEDAMLPRRGSWTSPPLEAGVFDSDGVDQGSFLHTLTR